MGSRKNSRPAVE